MVSSRSRLRSLFCAGAVLALGACGSLADLLTPGQRGTEALPAMLSFQANVAMPADGDAGVVTLRIATSYVRRDASRVPIASLMRSLAAAELQSVPIPVDVAPCLADPERDGGGGSCSVFLELALLVDGTVVDEQLIGPIRLTPGLPASLAAPVSLFQIDSIGLVNADASPLGDGNRLSLAPGASRRLVARVLDSRGQLVADRPVTWTSDAPLVASIAADGTITAVGEGSARVTAALGTLRATAVATVVRPRVALEIVGQAGSGRGTVRSTPAGIDCVVNGTQVSGSCRFEFPADARVTLRSTADAGSRFTAFGPDCAPTGTPGECVVTLTEPRAASVQFSALRRVSLTASAVSDGSGRITGPEGFDCRISGTVLTGNCSVQVTAGTAVTLTAEPGEPGARQAFAGWAGACDPETAATCTVVAVEDVTVRAGFFAARTLSVDLAGSGAGRIGGVPSLVCERADGATVGTCIASFVHGSTVTLEALPADDADFLGWGDACTGTTTVCAVRLVENRSVRATFDRRRATITVVVTGAGDGSVQLNGEIFCTATLDSGDEQCTRRLDAGSEVTLRAEPGEGSEFVGWSGACAGVTTTTCRVPVITASSVTANFRRRVVTLFLTLSGEGAGRVTLDGPTVCSLSFGANTEVCTQEFFAGTTVRLRGVAGASSSFEGFHAACTGSAECVLVLSESRSVEARFAPVPVRITMEAGSASSGSGQVTAATAGGIDCAYVLGALGTGRCSMTTNPFRPVRLTATPAPASALVAWGGACVGATTVTCDLTPAADAVASARFEAAVSVSMVVSGPANAGTITFTVPDVPMQNGCASGATGSASCPFALPLGATGVFRATPANGFEFVGFSGPCVEGIGPVPTCTYRGFGFIREIQAVFRRP